MSELDIRNISIHFGGLKAVSDFSLSVDKGELVAIIGPNGAGKTTLFNMISGLYRPTEGDILLDGESMVGRKPHIFTQRGIARTFQNIRLFGNATVIDNLKIAMTFQTRYKLGGSLLRNEKFMREEKEMDESAMEMLKIFHLEDKADYVAMNLPYGEQRKLEIARAMITKPRILLLDEPCAGMITGEIADLIQLIRDIRQRFNITILLIEHHMSIVMSIADRIKVLDFGETIAFGKPKEIQSNPRVIEAYLGGGYADVENK